MWLLLIHDGYRKSAAVSTSLYGLLCGLDVLASKLLLDLAAEYIISTSTVVPTRGVSNDDQFSCYALSTS